MKVKELFLVRHGETEFASLQRYPNGDRPLSAIGAEKIELLAQRLIEKDLRPDLILHSPLLRTTQTAAIIGARLGVALTIGDYLVEDSSYEIWGNELGPLYQNNESLMIVGHEPGLVGFLSAAARIPIFEIPFSRGTLVHLELSELTPYVLGRVKEVIRSEMPN